MNTENQYGLPKDFILRMEKMLKEEELLSFLRSYNRQKIQALRVNTLKISTESFCRLSPFSMEQVPWVKEGFYYDGESELSLRPGKHPYHDAGLYYIQEPSAMSVAAMSGTVPGEKVLDLCAAPGGKATQLASMLQGEGLLIANEIHPARAKILSQNIERMGIANTVVTNETPQSLVGFFPSFFDRIIVDAPCSGEGMFVKEEQAGIQWSPENVTMCAGRQDEILNCAYGMLKEGGTIVYSTCTFSPEEDEGSVSRFVAKYPDLVISSSDVYNGFAPGRPEWGNGNPDLVKTYRLWPHQIKGEGHYVAVIKRQGERLTCNDAVKSLRVDKNAVKLYEEFVTQNLKVQLKGDYLLFGDNLYLISYPLNLKGMKVVRPGLHLGTLAKNRFEPSHALALHLKPEQVARTIDFPSFSPEIAAYLRGEAIQTQAENGWTLVTTDGYSIGFGKQSSGTLKNHYPKGLRHS